MRNAQRSLSRLSATGHRVGKRPQEPRRGWPAAWHAPTLDFIRDQLSEPLTLSQVARVSGFAPDYFGRLFRREEGVSFSDYVIRQRVARAKQLISGTHMSMEQVRKLCGFGARTYFHQVFKRQTGMTPIEFRKRR